MMTKKELPLAMQPQPFDMAVNNANRPKETAPVKHWMSINIEEEIAKLTAPYITPDHIENMIAKIDFHQFAGTTVTICCLTLTNGFNMVGQSACVSLANFNEKLGQKLAYEDAKRQIGRFEGYVLARILNNQEPKGE